MNPLLRLALLTLFLQLALPGFGEEPPGDLLDGGGDPGRFKEDGLSLPRESRGPLSWSSPRPSRVPSPSVSRWSRERPFTLVDQRDDSLLYNSSLLFGPAWGYPAGPILDRTQQWLLDHATAHGGGVRYFEGLGYGQDLFFFTTSAAAQYAATTGDHSTSLHLLD